MANGVHPLGCYGCGVLFIAVCIFLSFSYRTLCLVITSFAQISWCSCLCLLDGHPLLWDSEYQLFAWTSCRHVSIVGRGRDWWLSLYVFPPTSPKYRAIKMEKKKQTNKLYHGSQSSFYYSQRSAISLSSVSSSTGSHFTCLEPRPNRLQHKTDGALVQSNSSVIPLLLFDVITTLENKFSITIDQCERIYEMT